MFKNVRKNVLAQRLVRINLVLGKWLKDFRGQLNRIEIKINSKKSSNVAKSKGNTNKHLKKSLQARTKKKIKSK